MKVIIGLGIMTMASGLYAQSECSSSYDQSWPYHGILGEKAIVAATYDAQASVFADCNKAQFAAGQSASAFIFNNEIQLAGTDLGIGVDVNDSKWLSSGLTVLGFELDVVDLEHDEALDWSHEYSLPLGISDEISFAYGPFGFPIEYGLSGVAGIEIAANLGGMVIGASAIPFVEADAYLAGGVDFWVVKAMLRGDLELISDQFEVAAAVSLNETLDGLAFSYGVDASNELNALGGKISFAAWSGWSSDPSFEVDLFSWQGFVVDSEIASIEESLYL